MLTVVRSPLPGVPLEGSVAPVADILAELVRTPHRVQWIVPTSRRRRALLRDWLPRIGSTAALLPGLHTLETFVTEALTYSLRQRPTVSGPERLLRLARAWQEVVGRQPGSGLVGQLDGLVRDWQACCLDVPARRGDLFEGLVERYLRDLEADGRLDRMGKVRVLTEEVLSASSSTNVRFLSRFETVVIDGFHRLELAEMGLIAALAQRCDVLVWLVGVPGRRSWQTLETASEYLQEHGARVVDHVPDDAPPLAALGRRLFSSEPAKPGTLASVPGLFQMKVEGPTDEVEAVATRIKDDYLRARGTDRPLRLSEVAVVIPGPAYDPLVREVFDRAGLPFNLAGQALQVSTSRPARVLTAAVQLIQGQWRYDLLLDFLNLPLVKRRLQNSFRLYDFFEQRPRARQRLTYAVWTDSWAEQVRRLRQRIALWQDGKLALPERVRVPREEHIERQTELADGLEELVRSIQVVLRPVVALEEALTRSSPQPEDRVGKLVSACVELLDTIDIAHWLAPPPLAGDSAVPWVEYEKDQQAYYKLLGILQTLTTLPEDRLPLTSDKKPDALAALCLALEAETYQIKTEDDAGVQVFEMREVRGLPFRHVYALGLVDGQVPPPPEEGAFGRRRRDVTALAEQMEQRESEATYLFAQLFEAAAEQLILVRPRQSGDREALPSPFLAAVEVCAPLREPKPVSLVVNRRVAESWLGRAAAHGKSPVDLWPGIEMGAAAQLAQVLQGLTTRQANADWPRRPHVDAPTLLRLVFSERRAFSPSELETFAACPFRYFGSRVLNLQERETDPTRIDYGSLIHRVLQRFYQERQSGGEPVAPVTTADRGRLVELFDEEWQQLDDGTLPPDLQALFRVQNGVLDLFLQIMNEIEGQEGYGNWRVELELEGVLLGKDRHGLDVYLSGKIDRVDLRRNDVRKAIILDYKTGKTVGPGERRVKVEDGRLLQLPLYGAALSLAHDGLEVIGGAYVHLSERPSSRPEPARAALGPVGPLLRDGARSPVIPFDMVAARQLAIDLAGEIRAGRFSLTLHDVDSKHGECKAHCPTRHACRHPSGYETPYTV